MLMLGPEVFLNGKWQRFDPTGMIPLHSVLMVVCKNIEQDRSIFGAKQSTWAYQQFSMMKKLRVW